jgi:hypothetical protein
MKAGLKISLFLNLGLAGGLILVLLLQGQKDRGIASQSAVSGPSVSAVVASAPPAIDSEPFQWKQLESMDNYREYVAKLRAAGCPEPTVEDIVRGDVGRIFSLKRRELNLDGSSAGPWSRQREAIAIAGLLGQAMSPDDLSVQPAPRPASQHDTAPATYPLAFENVNLDALGLKPAGKEAVQDAIAQIREQFIERIGGTNQDVSDPAYLERWRKAQPDMDSALRGTLGDQAFLEYQMAAQGNVHGETGTTSP